MCLRSWDMTCKELSLRLGHDANCLNVYRRKRDLPKKTSPLAIYEMYRAEKQNEDRLAIELQNAYYDLQDNKQLSKFGLHLVSIGLMSHHNSIHEFFNRCFATHKRIIGKYYTSKRQKVLEAYKEWKND